MTEKLFYKDSYLRTFTAVVQSCQPAGEGYKILLERTAFFPEGGGQYADNGLLGDKKVLDVQELEGLIFHLTEAAIKPGKTVTGSIDWDERFMKMQQHTGEHIVSGLVHEAFGYDNVGFHLGSEDCTMDFNGEITKEQLSRIERRANEVVVKNLEVQVSYPSEAELAVLDYRSKIEIEGQTRIVTIPGYDVCACCAPHVKRSGEIGLIKLTNVQRYKGGVRVTMLCGFRALADYSNKANYVKAISALLSAKENTIVDAVTSLKDECAELKQKLVEKQTEIFRQKAKALPGDETVICLFERELAGDGSRILMNLVLDQKGKELCAVFQGDDQSGYRYVMGSKTMDVRALAKALNEAFSGRGGGKPEMVQGAVWGDAILIEEWIQKKVREQKG